MRLPAAPTSEATTHQLGIRHRESTVGKPKHRTQNPGPNHKARHGRLGLGVLVLPTCLALAGCVHEYRAFNPYPNIHKVAVAPFINLSNHPSVDGRHVGTAYYAELQKVPGFEVVPIGVVETAMRQHGLTLSGAGEAQQLARILGADCVVVGAVSDFTPYYPPRLAMQIEWYAADPDSVFETPTGGQVRTASPTAGSLDDEGNTATTLAQAQTEIEPPLPGLDSKAEEPPAQLQPPPQSPQMLPSQPSMPQIPLPGDPPILTYTRLFDGADEQFTRALADYLAVRHDVRFGGVQGYLQRTDDFIRFACHQAIYEMLGRTPGAVETRLVFRTPNRR